MRLNVIEFYLLYILFSRISCQTPLKTICDSLVETNSVFNYGFTEIYRNLLTNYWTFRSKVFIGNKYWLIEQPNNQITGDNIAGDRNTVGDNAYGITANETQYKFQFALIKGGMRSSQYINDSSVAIISFDNTTFIYNYYVYETRAIRFEQNANPFHGFEPLMAYVPDSFLKSDEMQNTVIFIAQKYERTESSYFYEYKRTFTTLKVTAQYDESSGGSLRFEPDDVADVPEFLKKLPKNYFLNAILHFYELHFECIDCHPNQVILLVTVDGVPKYCATEEDTLSEQCSQQSLKTYLSCGWMSHVLNKTEQHNGQITSLKPHDGTVASNKASRSPKIGIILGAVLAFIVILVLVVFVVVCVFRKRAQKLEQTDEVPKPPASDGTGSSSSSSSSTQSDHTSNDQKPKEQTGVVKSAQNTNN